MRLVRVSILLWAIACISNANAADSTIAMTPKQQQAMGVVVSAMSKSNAESTLRLPGEIVIPTSQERIVSAVQGGLIDVLNVAAGMEVKKGQVLGHITSSELVSQQRDFLQAATRYRLAKNSLDRDAELFKDGIIAERRYIATKSDFEDASANLSQSKQTLRLGGMSDAGIAQLERSGKYVNGVSFVAPIAGQVLEQMVSIGQRVDVATPLLRIGRLSPLWLEIHAPVEHLAVLRQGMLVRIPSHDAEGKIITIIRAINKNDQTVHVRAEILQNAEKLSPGQFVEADVMTQDLTAAATDYFALPKQAIIRQGRNSFVFVQNAKGFIPVKVTVISEQTEKAIVTGKFPENARVAISGTVAIKAAWNASGE
ncbi:MAG TPA: efflux RND transporter periplasmic adaptor subunit [Methylophilus sp.]|nr:efflux RND transporter periplasmic adaptor subunit [Methylophilus sp.]HQQ33761.1 efflux RND transporter periplasmic adaptor subunit [Methylophilus sp.]